MSNQANEHRGATRPSNPGSGGPPVQSGSTAGQYADGPTSIEGVEASDLPDKGRGPVDTDPGKELRRKVPGQTGGTIGGDVGMRATPEAADAADHGHRKHN